MIAKTNTKKQLKLMQQISFYIKALRAMPFFVRLAFLSIGNGDDGFDRYARKYGGLRNANKHRFLLITSLRGLGILNYKNPEDSGELGFIKTLMEGNDAENHLIIDAGANIGNFALWALSSTKYSKVISFEPNPSACVECRTNLRDYRERWSLIEKAVGNECKEAVIWDYAEESGSSHASLYKEVLENIHGADAKAIRIYQTTIDTELASTNSEVTLIKIDIEGHELSALQGSRETIRRHKPKAILIEFNEMNAVSGSSFYNISREIGPDYEPFRLLPGGDLLPLKSLPIVETEIYAFQNIAFMRRETSVLRDA
jgi:FkbM family methyltransferase